MNQSSDRWDRVLAFHKSRAALVLVGVAAAFVIFWDNSAWTIPLKVVVLVLAASYWIAIGVKSVQGFRSGYRDPN